MFNRSKSEYLICYHGPKLMIDRYEFNIELITQTSTTMHGSSEVHTGYIYRRSKTIKAKVCKSKKFGVPCDPLFAEAWEICESGVNGVSEHTANQVSAYLDKTKKRFTRSDARKILGEKNS